MTHVLYLYRRILTYCKATKNWLQLQNFIEISETHLSNSIIKLGKINNITLQNKCVTYMSL